MPCNPVDFEIPYNSSGDDYLFLKAKELLEEHQFVSKLFKTVKGAYPEEKEFIQSSEKITAQGYSMVDDDVSFRNKLLKLESGDATFSKETFLKEIEEALCIKRQELIRLYKILPCNGGIAKAYYEEIKKKHLEHRNADRQQWYYWLDAKRSLLLKDPQSATNELLKQKLEKIQQEIERIRNLSDQELLSDREIFGRNQEEFSIE